MKTINRFLCALIAATVTTAAPALPPEPAPPQSGPIALVGATIHVGDGTVIENATVTFAEGRITGVGTDIDTAGHRQLDVSGQHVYPGFILPDSDVGLVEVGSLPDTVDNQDAGDMNPNLRALVAYNTDSEMTPTLRYNGVLIAQVSPVAGMVSGTSSIVQLDAWNWEDAALVADDGVFVNWPSRQVGQFDFSTFTFRFVDNEQYDEQLQRLTKLLHDARAYHTVEPEAPNLKLAALSGLFDGSQRLYVRSNVAADIVRAVDTARSAGVRQVVVIAEAEALEVAEYLVEHEVPVIVSGVHRLPEYDYSDVDLPYRLPALLLEAGVTTGLTYPSLMSSRNLGFIAGTVAAHGLDREQALSLITLNNAKILGIEERLGSIEPGKDATLFVSRGDALDMRGNDVTSAFIGGRQITLPGTQQELYRRYHEKYAEE